MRPRLATVLLAGCSFSGPGPTASSDPTDAPTAATACSVAATSGATPANASLGDPGTAHGNPQPGLACAPGELPIGIGLSTTTDPRPEGGAGGERVALAITIQCGTIARREDHSFAITSGSRIGFDSNPCNPSWEPSTVAPAVSCPANMVLVGLTGNGGAASLFNTVGLTCAALTPTGEVGATASSVAVVDTGNYTNKPQTAGCRENQAVVGFAIRANCAIDKLTPTCAPLRCN